MPREIFTIGTTSRSREDFLQRIESVIRPGHSVSLIDIRRYADANAFETNWAAGKFLAPVLADHGVGYEHELLVAPSRKLLRDHKHGLAVEPCDCRSVVNCAKKKIHRRRQLTLGEFQQRYVEELRSGEGLRTIDARLERDAGESIILLCACQNFRQCHRKMLTDELASASGGRYSVRHL